MAKSKGPKDIKKLQNISFYAFIVLLIHFVALFLYMKIAGYIYFSNTGRIKIFSRLAMKYDKAALILLVFSLIFMMLVMIISSAEKRK